jgi:hypothetical protein
MSASLLMLEIKRLIEDLVTDKTITLQQKHDSLEEILFDIEALQSRLRRKIDAAQQRTD